ncbi:hypothetical protein [Alteromonas ponticola]|uniref:Uncharacterized protein n=1 Tax=Alteromonas ponticola TaxID=2720613 RepID=A0ABX1R5Q9_9ALTE|nr:hypothetical protein [Alteromonas ponticola]NMH60816.1 hypothetical protein [Alteromonas ponticola]
MSEHVKLVIGQLPLYKLPITILLATSMIFMAEREQASIASVVTKSNIKLSVTELKKTLHTKLQSFLTEYALARLDVSADEMIDDIFHRIQRLIENNRFYQSAASQLSTQESSLLANGMLPMDWKRQLMAYLLPAFTMDKRMS